MLLPKRTASSPTLVEIPISTFCRDISAWMRCTAFLQKHGVLMNFFCEVIYHDMSYFIFFIIGLITQQHSTFAAPS